MDFQAVSELANLYNVSGFYDAKVYYDSSKMNQETIKISAKVLPMEYDADYEVVELQLKRAKESYVSGWKIEDYR